MAGEESLRPVRWRGLPRGGTLLRVALVAALLGLAATVLTTPAGCPPPGAAPAGPPPTRRSPEPTALGGGSVAPGPGQPGAALPLPSGSVGVPVRLAEPAALAVLHPGARVDLLVVPAGGAPGAATLLAPRALVLDVVGAAGAADGSSALYLALRPEQAQRAVGVPEGSRFAVVVRG
ncbi:flagellar biosynthesis protein FlgA [Micromonospora sp. NPDC049836]|uniref:flagellar biosynthesis protein FlgA n=1 Tax=Micromonospora sp. NPDC049836 TaxID=3364274 RepID=UPI0037B299C8